MFNQKGQAFSVFELMIAAIVAIAILFVLLPIIGGITTPAGSAVDEIGNVLSSIQVGGTRVTQAFVIEPNEAVSSDYFSMQGIDKCAVYFESGAFGSNQIITDLDAGGFVDDDCYFYFENVTNRSIQAKATVVCESNAEILSNRLRSLSDRKPYTIDDRRPEDIWSTGSDYAGYSKVCVVILERA